MDQIYLDNVKSTNSNTKWVNIDEISGRGLHTLECEEVIAKFRIFSGHDCLVTQTSLFYVIKIPS